jgi:hypothetical protein
MRSGFRDCPSPVPLTAHSLVISAQWRKITHRQSAQPFRTASFWGNDPFQKVYMMVHFAPSLYILEAWNITCNRSILIPIRSA